MPNILIRHICCHSRSCAYSPGGNFGSVLQSSCPLPMCGTAQPWQQPPPQESTSASHNKGVTFAACRIISVSPAQAMGPAFENHNRVWQRVPMLPVQHNRVAADMCTSPVYDGCMIKSTVFPQTIFAIADTKSSCKASFLGHNRGRLSWTCMLGYATAQCFSASIYQIWHRPQEPFSSSRPAGP